MQELPNRAACTVSIQKDCCRMLGISRQQRSQTFQTSRFQRIMARRGEEKNEVSLRAYVVKNGRRSAALPMRGRLPGAPGRGCPVRRAPDFECTPSASTDALSSSPVLSSSSPESRLLPGPSSPDAADGILSFLLRKNRVKARNRKAFVRNAERHAHARCGQATR